MRSLINMLHYHRNNYSFFTVWWKQATDPISTLQPQAEQINAAGCQQETLYIIIYIFVYIFMKGEHGLFCSCFPLISVWVFARNSHCCRSFLCVTSPGHDALWRFLFTQFLIFYRTPVKFVINFICFKNDSFHKCI